MPAISTSSGNVKWNVSVAPDFDEAIRVFLAARGGKKGSLSKLVQDAVAWYVLDKVAEDARREVTKQGLTESQIDDLIEESLQWARAQ